MLPQFDNTEIAFKYKTTNELKHAQLLFSTMNYPMVSALGMKLVSWSMKVGLPVKGIIKNTLFRQFCGGETLQEVAHTAGILKKYNMGVILDYSIEGQEEERVFDDSVPAFIKAIQHATTERNISFVSLKVTGFARFNLLEKVHAKQILSETEEAEWERVKERIKKICACAFENQIKVLIDAEESWVQNAVDALADDMMVIYNKKTPLIYNTYQLYCHETLAWLKTSHEKAVKLNYILGAKLVRGAYMEKERARALAKNYPSPIQPDKAATDKDYNEAVMYCLQNFDTVATFIGTHNEDSCRLAVVYIHENNLPKNDAKIYFSQLYGMSDNISFNLSDAGYNVAKYLPYGPVKYVIPYLLRRAEENTSVAGQTNKELFFINKELKRRKKAKV